jgi:anti-sigma factor RsiW
MEITRDIILDLLPVYLAGGVSDDTRRLVEARLASDASLAAAARHLRSLNTDEEDLMPVHTEIQLAAFREAKRLQLRTTMIWAGIVGILLASTLVLLAAGLMFRG